LLENTIGRCRWRTGATRGRVATCAIPIWPCLRLYGRRGKMLLRDPQVCRGKGAPPAMAGVRDSNSARGCRSAATPAVPLAPMLAESNHGAGRTRPTSQLPDCTRPRSLRGTTAAPLASCAAGTQSPPRGGVPHHPQAP
jgi:hypothetical protein